MTMTEVSPMCCLDRSSDSIDLSWKTAVLWTIMRSTGLGGIRLEHTDDWFLSMQFAYNDADLIIHQSCG